MGLVTAYFEEVAERSGVMSMLAAYRSLSGTHPYCTEEFTKGVSAYQVTFTPEEIANFKADLTGDGLLGTVFTVHSRCAAVAFFEESMNQDIGLVGYFWLYQLAKVCALDPHRIVSRHVAPDDLSEPGRELNAAGYILRKAILESLNKIR